MLVNWLVRQCLGLGFGLGFGHKVSDKRAGKYRRQRKSFTDVAKGFGSAGVRIRSLWFYVGFKVRIFRVEASGCCSSGANLVARCLNRQGCAVRLGRTQSAETEF